MNELEIERRDEEKQIDKTNRRGERQKIKRLLAVSTFRKKKAETLHSLLTALRAATRRYMHPYMCVRRLYCFLIQERIVILFYILDFRL